MEYNAIANIKILIDMIKENPNDSGKLERIEEQVDMLHMYMKRVAATLTPEQVAQIPAWHEIIKEKNNKRG